MKKASRNYRAAFTVWVTQGAVQENSGSLKRRVTRFKGGDDWALPEDW
jgi:hypothetical protein